MTTLLTKKSIIPYFTFGHPSTAFTCQLVETAFEAGVDVVEIGIPFSDPIADGPVIQASHTLALNSGEDVSISAALKVVKDIKSRWPTKSIVFMLAVNLVIQFGIEKFFTQAAAHQVDGVIIPDLPMEFASKYTSLAKRHHVALILLLSTATSPKRLKQIAQSTQGFLYLISSKGTTGERAVIQENLNAVVKLIRSTSKIPVAIGFGIHSDEQVANMGQIADGVIIGSYFERMVQESKNLPRTKQEICRILKRFSNSLSTNR